MKSQKMATVPLIVLISAFITLDFTLLYVNLTLTHKLEHDALIINVSGRQRMLSQLIAKHLLINCPESNSFSVNTELLNSVTLFDQTLTSLRDGGDIITADGQTVAIKALDDPQSQRLLNQASSLWSNVYQSIMAVTLQPNKEHFDVISQFSSIGNNDILELMNDLSIVAERVSNRDAKVLRHAQVFIFILVLINFILIVFRFYQANRNNTAFMTQLDALVHNLPQAIFLIDHNESIIYTNAVSSHIFSISEETFLGEDINTYISNYNHIKSFELYTTTYEISVSTVRSIPHEVKMISLLDITETELIKHKSLFDPLTQLFNRNGLIETYSQIENRASTVICLFLDLDKFKKINDRYGHSVGDEVLCVIAQRLQSCTKSEDIVARFGGDEFVIVLNLDLTSQDIENYCSRIRSVIRKEIDIDHLIIQVGVSIGIRIGYPQDESLDVMIDDADRAMYTDKKQRRTDSSSNN